MRQSRSKDRGKPTRQKARKGHYRVPCYTCAERSIRRWIEREATRRGCSMSLVIIEALSVASGIPLYDTYRRR